MLSKREEAPFLLTGVLAVMFVFGLVAMRLVSPASGVSSGPWLSSRADA